jgi:hypothetical protein
MKGMRCLPGWQHAESRNDRDKKMLDEQESLKKAEATQSKRSPLIAGD